MNRAGRPEQTRKKEGPMLNLLKKIRSKFSSFQIILIGFAAETSQVIENAEAKLAKKNLDMIVANDVTRAGAGFNVDTNIATLITREGQTDMPLQSKRSLAEAILDRASAMLRAGGQSSAD